MKVKEIKEKTITGAKWSVILSLIALPIGYMINIILGRVSPSALGIYGITTIFDSFVVTFILFGGGNVITKYIPEIKENQNNFLISYMIIILVIVTFFIMICELFPGIWDIIFGTKLSNNIITYLIILIPILIFYYFFDYVLNGLMEIKTSVSLRQITTYGTFIIFTILFIFYKNFFKNNLWLIILGTYSLFCVLLAILAFIATIRKINGDVNLNLSDFHFYLPNKFWSFAIIVQISSILIFVYDRLDQILVLHYFGISTLGYYFAAIQTASIIRFIPMILGNVLLPTFSNLLILNEFESIKKGYSLLAHYNTLIVVISSLFCIFFSKQIMGIFGPNYEIYNPILVILSISFMLCSLGNVNSALIISTGKVKANLINSSIQIVLQVILMLGLLGILGINGFAIGKGLGVVIAQIGLFYIISKLNLGIKIPRNYKISVFIAILAGVLYLILQPDNLIMESILFFFITLLFLYFGKYSKEDIIFLINIIRGKNV